MTGTRRHLYHPRETVPHCAHTEPWPGGRRGDCRVPLGPVYRGCVLGDEDEGGETAGGTGAHGGGECGEGPGEERIKVEGT